MCNMCLKESSINLLEIEKFVESIIHELNETDYPFVEVEYNTNTKKLVVGSLSNVITFGFNSDFLSYKKSINVIMTFNDKLNVYNITLTESERDGLKILYTFTGTIEDLMNNSKVYIKTIVEKAMITIANRFYGINLTSYT